MSLIDADDLEPGTVLTSQVCIVGAGPVGIALALRLASLGVDSLLLESGGFEFEEQTQALTEGAATNYYDLTTTRIRRLGGTSNHWGGQSRPLEPVDFVDAPWRGGYGWPIGRDDALAYLDDAIAFVGLPDSDFSHGRWFPDEPQPDGAVLEDKVFMHRPVPFGVAYRDELVASDRVTLVLHANVTSVRVDTASGAVSSLEVATLAGTEFTAQAQEYVIATGGIESARLLLASTDDVAGGVGNGSDLVGRYFSDHHAVGPVPLVPGPAPLVENAEVPPTEGDIDPELPTTVTRYPASWESTQTEQGVTGFHAIVLGLDVPDTSEGVEALFVEGIEKLVHLGTGGPTDSRAVVVGFEQIPNPDSRVTLAEETDAFGRPLAALEWAFTDDDAHQMDLAMELVARHLAVQGIGRLRMLPVEGRWIDVVSGQHHHMGTLRMGTTPADSVVDTDLRFHDVANLYAVGAAVFPTYGHVNPTLNAVALAERLARHLAGEVT